jgi:N-acyl-D-aspartate/D-glutamate deacylase
MHASGLVIRKQTGKLMNKHLSCLILGAMLTGCGSDVPQDLATANVTAIDETTVYDIVLEGGRVIDPDSGVDAVMSVGISDGQIAAVSETPLQGTSVIDVSGQVVAPGFINIHSHSWTPEGQRFEVLDGVTTALEQESGAFPVAGFGTHGNFAIAKVPRINFGASVGHAWIRSAILQGDAANFSFDHLIARSIQDGGGISMEQLPAFNTPLNSEQKVLLRSYLEQGLEQGGLGIGMLLDYMSDAVDEEEMRVVFEVSGQHQAPIFVHIRRGIAGDTAGLLEVIQLAKETGAPVHVCHVQASGMGNIAEFLRLIREARAEGVQITTESFPYNAGSTSNNAAVFNRDWQTIFDITYEDVQWAATGEYFDEAMWNEYREKHPGGIVIHHYNKEEWTRIATEAPDVIVAADGAPIFSLEQKVAPFGMGTNSRILGHYVREEGTLSLHDAIAKMTILPARVLSAYSPSMARKGRVQVGADADITVFDPTTVMDNATFENPYQASSGITHVLVNGEFVVFQGELQQDSYPGTRVLRHPN